MTKSTSVKSTSVTEPTPVVTVKRPTTCGAWVAANPDNAAAEGRDVTCKRLPRHKGECRVTRKAPKVPKAVKAAAVKASPKGKAPRRTAAQIRRDEKAVIATLLEKGILSADEAMAAVAALA